MSDSTEVRVLPNGDRLVSNKEVQWRLGIKRTTIYQLVKRGELRCVKIGSRALFSEKELDKYIQKLFKEASVSDKGVDTND